MPTCRRPSAVAIAVAVLWRSAEAAGPAAEPPLQVGVAIEGSVAVAARYGAGTIAEADAIWRRHGVTVFLTASSETLPGDVRLALRFEAAEQRGEPKSLGSITFGDDGRPNPALRVDHLAVMDRLRQAAGAARSPFAWPTVLAEIVTMRALGRVLAHELGHYLLASPAHMRQGLMRAAFDGRQLADWHRRGFQLHETALPRLRARLARLESARRPVIAARETP